MITFTDYTWVRSHTPYIVSVGNATRQYTSFFRTMGTVYIQAAVFYNVALSDAQHLELSEKMNAI